MATGQGTLIFNFGSVPGTNIVTTVVAVPTISANSKVEVFLMGTDSTSTHNAYEHSIIEMAGISLTCINVSAGIGFTAQAATLLRLTGTITARYVWAD